MSHDAHLSGYTIRRPASRASLLPAIGVGLTLGLTAFYVTLVLLEREPLLTPEERERRARALERRTGRRVSTLGGEMVGGAEDLELDEELDDALDEAADDVDAELEYDVDDERLEEADAEAEEHERSNAWDRGRA